MLFDGLVDELETLGRQQDKHPASIPWIRLAGEQADSLQAVDALGNCAGGHHHRLGERPRREDGVSSLAFAGWQLTAGGLLLAPSVLIIEGVPATLSASNLGGYAYLSLIGAALTYPLWFRGISQLGAPVVSFLVLLSPVVAALLGAVVLAQTFTFWQTLGFIIVLASVLAGQLPPRDRSNARAPTARAGNTLTRPEHGSTPRPPRTPRRRI